MTPWGSRLGPEDHIKGWRERLYNEVFADPGVNFVELSRRTTLAYGALQYHLSILERFGYVESHKAGRYRRYFARSFDYDEAPLNRARAYAKNPGYARLLDILENHPGASQAELARRYGKISRQGVGYLAKKCVELGLVEMEQNGSRHAYRLSGGYAGERSAQETFPAHPDTLQDLVTPADTFEERYFIDRARKGV